MSGISTGTPRSSSVVAGAGPASQPQRRGVDLLDPERAQADRGPHHVDQGVGRAHLVEMDLLAGRAVHLGFGVGQPLEDGAGLAADDRIDVGGVDHGDDMTQVAVRLNTRHLHLDARRHEWSAPGVAHPDADTLELEPRRQGLQLGRRPAGRDQGPQAHVAADARETVEVGEAHQRRSPAMLTRWAA
jgi:hypothetical protein